MRIADTSRTSVSHRLLQPLLEGRAVALSIDDPKMRKKKRVKQATLFMVPSRLLGIDAGLLLCSIPGFGSEMVSTREAVNFMVFFRMGISVRMAMALAESLTTLFSGEKHGT